MPWRSTRDPSALGGVSMSVIVAASASLANVQTAVDSAVSGDQVHIPNGSATWASPLAIGGKRIIIRAQNYTPTAQPTTSTVRHVTITYSGTTGFAMDFATGNDFHCGVGGIKFLPPVAGEQTGASGIWGYVHFSGSGSKLPLLFDCHIVGNERQNVTAGEAAFLSWDSLGGICWNTLFDGSQVPDGLAGGGGDGMSGAGIHLSSPRAWATASTMGMLDSGGLVNVYVEDCHLLVWGQADGDDNTRLVVRHSTMNGCSWQTHGFTSAFGGRHVEIYDCDMLNSIDNRNHTRHAWLRAGTFLFTDCFASDQNAGFGAPSLLDIGDNTSPPGSYPVERGPGRGHNGSAHVADPIYLWSNTGGAATDWSVDAAWDSHVDLNRDIFVESGAKPDYSKFTYPHPLRSSVEAQSPELFRAGYAA